MSRLWLFCFPLLFLPNFGFSHQTVFGVVEISDWLIVPFIVLLIIAPATRYQQKVAGLNQLLLGFLVWASLTILSIHFRYSYLDDVPLLLGCFLKLAKLALYVSAGVLIAKKLSSSKVRTQWLWSLLAAVVMLSMGLLASNNNPGPQSDALEGYKSYNAVIVSMAILCAYIAGLWIDDVGTRKWRLGASLVLAFAVSSVILSASLSTHGRGGWLALIVGCGYIFWKKTRRIKSFAVILVLGLAGIAAYRTLPNFESLVEATISPSQEEVGNGLNDGTRLTTWAHEAPKLIDAPLLGTGFYHRGGFSNLWDTGSHNFFIQMFLETGVVGGSLVLMIFGFMWRQMGSMVARQNRISLATRAAWIAAVVGGMSGEYYYGGTSILVLFAIFAMGGALPAANVVQLTETRPQIERRLVAS